MSKPFLTPIVLPAAASGYASMRLPHGTAPSSPTNGDVWTTTAGLFAQINGSTVGPFAAGGVSTTGSPASGQVTFFSGASTITNAAGILAGATFAATATAGGLSYSANSGTFSTDVAANGFQASATSTAALTGTTLQRTFTAFMTSTGSSTTASARLVSAYLVNQGTPVVGAVGTYVGTYILCTKLSANATAGATYMGADVFTTIGNSDTSGTVALNAIGTRSGVGVNNSGASGSVTVTNAYDFLSNPTYTFSVAVTTVVTNSYGLYLTTPTVTGGGTLTITNRYGVYQEDTAAQNFFAGYTGLGVAATTGTALSLPVSVSARSSLRIPHGSAPTTNLANGDIWTTTAGLFARINGATVGPYGAGTISGSIASTQIAFGSGTNSINGSATLTFGATTGMVLAPTAVSSGLQTAFRITGAANTNLAAGNEAIDVNINLARTVQWATGAHGQQRAVLVQAPTYAFVGASTLTTAATVAITGAPIAGTNATITTSVALDIETGLLRTAASTTTVAGLRLPHGSAPSSPVNGDMWTTTTGLFARINGATSGIVGTTGTPAANDLALFSAAGTITNAAGIAAGTTFTGTATSGALLLSHAAGTYTSTGSVSGFLHSVTFSGNSTSAFQQGFLASVTATGVPTSVNVTTAAVVARLAATPATAVSDAKYIALHAQLQGSTAASFASNNVLYAFRAETNGISSTTNATGFGSVFAINAVPGFASGIALGTVTATHVYGVAVTPIFGTAAGGSGATATNYYGLHLGTPTVTGAGFLTITNRYGVYQADTAAQNYFAGYSGLGVTADTGTALNLPASVTTRSSLRIAHGVAPTTNLTDGDIWTTTAGLFARINGATAGPFIGAPGGSDTQVQYNSSGTLAGSSRFTWDDTGAGGLTLTNTGVVFARTQLTASLTLGTSPAAGQYRGLYANATWAVNSTDIVTLRGVMASVSHTGSDASVNTGTLTGGYFDVQNSRSAGSLAALHGVDVLTTLLNSATTTDVYGVRITLTGTGTITSLYGLYLSDGLGGTITNRYGIYQVGASSQNVLAGQLLLSASTTTRAGLRLPHGTAPSSPVNGDVWTASDGIYAYVGGATAGPFGTSVTAASTGYVYFGAEATDGTWRIGRSGNDLVIERRESGSYVSKQTILA